MKAQRPRHDQLFMETLTMAKPVYRVFGLNIDSEVPFPDMSGVEGVADVVIRHGKVPAEIPDAKIKGVRIRPDPARFCCASMALPNTMFLMAGTSSSIGNRPHQTKKCCSF